MKPIPTFSKNKSLFKEKRLLFENIDINSPDAVPDQVKDKEVTNFGCPAGTKVERYDEQNKTYHLSDYSKILEVAIENDTKLLRVTSDLRFFDEKGNEIKVEKTEKTNEKIQAQYKKTLERLQAAKKAVDEEIQKALDEKKIDNKTAEGLKTSADRALTKLEVDLNALRQQALDKLENGNLLYQATAEKISGAFTGETDKLKWDEVHAEEPTTIELKDVEKPQDMVDWMKVPANKTLMRKHLLNLEGQAGPTTPELTINFKNAQEKLGLTDDQYKALTYGVSIGNLFDDDELKYISIVTGRQGRSGGGKVVEEKATATHYAKEAAKYPKGVYAERKYLRIWDGSKIAFSAAELQEIPADEEPEAPAKKAKARPEAKEEKPEAAPKGAAEEPKGPTPASLPEVKKGEETTVLGKKVEAVDGGKYKVEGVQDPLDKKQAEVVLGVREASPDFTKDELKKQFPHIKQELLVGDPTYSKTNGEITATYESADGKDSMEVTCSVGVKNTSIDSVTGNPRSILKDSDEAFAWFIRTAETTTHAQYETTKEETAKEHIKNHKWQEALEAMLGEGGKYSVELAALCVENFDGNPNEIVGKERLQKDLAKFIPKYADASLTKDKYDKLKTFSVGDKLTKEEMAAFTKRLNELEKVSLDLVKELLVDTEKAPEVVEILLTKETGLGPKASLADLETEVPGITEILEKYQEKNPTDKVQTSILGTIAAEVIDDENRPNTATELEKAKKHAKYLNSYLKAVSGDQSKNEYVKKVYELLYSSDASKNSPDKLSEDATIWADYRLAKLGTTDRNKVFYQADLFNNLSKQNQEKYVKALATQYLKLDSTYTLGALTEATDPASTAQAQIEIATALTVAEVLKKGTPEEKFVAYKLEKKVSEHKEKGEFKFDEKTEVKKHYDGRKALSPELRILVLEETKAYCSAKNTSLDDAISSNDFIAGLEKEIAETKYEKGDYDPAIATYFDEKDPRRTLIDLYNSPAAVDQAKINTLSEAMRKGEVSKKAMDDLYTKVKAEALVDNKYKAMLAIELGYIGEARELVDGLPAGFTKDYLKIRLDPTDEYKKLIDITGQCKNDFTDTEEDYLKIQALVRLFNLSKGKENEAQVKAKLDGNNLLFTMRNVAEADFKGYSKEKQAQILEGLRVLVQCRGSSEAKYTDQIGDFYAYFRMKEYTLSDEDSAALKDPFDAQDYAWMNGLTTAMKKEMTEAEITAGASTPERYARMALLLYKKDAGNLSLLKVRNGTTKKDIWMPDAWVDAIGTDDYSKHLKYLFYKASGNYDKAVNNAKDKTEVLDLQLKEAKNDPKLLKEAGDDYATQGMYDKAITVYLQALGNIADKNSTEAAEVRTKVDEIFADNAKKGAVLAENRLKVAKFYEENKGYQKAADIYSTNNRPNELMTLYETHIDEASVSVDFDSLYTFNTSGKLNATRIINLLKNPSASINLKGTDDNKKAFMRANYEEIYNIVSDPDRNNVLSALGYEGKTKEEVKAELQIVKAEIKNILEQSIVGVTMFNALNRFFADKSRPA